jgi:hypothetical protein
MLLKLKHGTIHTCANNLERRRDIFLVEHNAIFCKAKDPDIRLPHPYQNMGSKILVNTPNIFGTLRGGYKLEAMCGTPHASQENLHSPGDFTRITVMFLTLLGSQ